MLFIPAPSVFIQSTIGNVIIISNICDNTVFRRKRKKERCGPFSVPLALHPTRLVSNKMINQHKYKKSFIWQDDDGSTESFVSSQPSIFFFLASKINSSMYYVQGRSPGLLTDNSCLDKTKPCTNKCSLYEILDSRQRKCLTCILSKKNIKLVFSVMSQ